MYTVGDRTLQFGLQCLEGSNLVILYRYKEHHVYSVLYTVGAELYPLASSVYHPGHPPQVQEAQFVQGRG
jgi:hypothetical protein